MPPSERTGLPMRALRGAVRDAVSVIDEPKIVTHNEPAARARTNYILRLDLTNAGLPGYYEQVWTRTDDKQRHELCCIPFFTYGLSLGDIFTVTADRAYRVEYKAGIEPSGSPFKIRPTPTSDTTTYTATLPESVF